MYDVNLTIAGIKAAPGSQFRGIPGFGGASLRLASGSIAFRGRSAGSGSLKFRLVDVNVEQLELVRQNAGQVRLERLLADHVVDSDHAENGRLAHGRFLVVVGLGNFSVEFPEMKLK